MSSCARSTEKEWIEETPVEELVAAQRELQLIAKRPDPRDRASLHRHPEQR